jgi:hypothetical protein
VAESSSFLKKRTKKLLPNVAEPIRTGRSPNDQEFFASFFKKAGLPALTGKLRRGTAPNPPPRRGWQDLGSYLFRIEARTFSENRKNFGVPRMSL